MARYPFPRIPSDEVTSAFIRQEIRRGSFEDLPHRQYVTELVYIEMWTRDRSRVVSGAYPPVKPWHVAARPPAEFDVIRAELGAPTRADLGPKTSAIHSGDEPEPRARHAREWRTVQER